MKENTDFNEAFVAFHEEQAALGKTPKEIEAAALAKWPDKFGGNDASHSYRARKSNLANKDKYGGKYAERMKKFQQQAKKKADVPVVAEGKLEPTITEEGNIELVITTT